MAVDRSPPEVFHELAKKAGDKLRAYVLSYASGATAVFFLALTGKDLQTFSTPEKALLIVGLLLFVVTAVLCLYELHIDARRFFHIAKQMERQQDERSWQENDAYKTLRVRLIYGSYLTVGLATAAVVGFLILRIA
jgi:hypothetical protein